jgi:phage baseplate assembly protein W
LTNPGERIFNPSFGAGLRAKIFEQIDQTSFEEMKNSISSQLENNFPQIQVTNLSITGDLESQIVNVNFSYKINRSNENDSVIVTIQTA